MTSLLFGATYLGYKKAVAHKQNKRKQVNYERWDSLRDDFDDEEKRRSSTQLDEQRPSASRGRPSAWDEEIPQHLKVERKSYDDANLRRQFNERQTSRPVSQAGSQRNISETGSQRNASEEDVRWSTSVSRTENVEPEQWHRPGGMMADLLEGRN